MEKAGLTQYVPFSTNPLSHVTHCPFSASLQLADSSAGGEAGQEQTDTLFVEQNTLR